MSNALAQMHWRNLQLFFGDFTGGGFVWLPIGLILAVVAISALAMDASLVLNAPHRLQSRVRWAVDVSESTVIVSPSQANLDGPGTPT
jgi:hypothetical protein